MDSTKDVPLVIDFTGTGPQAKGPINHCGDYADGNFLKKWLAPILRNLAETPERMAQLDVNEGVVPLIEMRFPEKGTLLTPIFPAPTNARTFVILRLLGVLAGVLAKATGGRMPADQETIRYTGVYGTDFDGEPYLMREVLGGGSGGRYYADGEDTIHVVPDSRNLPTEFTEGRFPLRVERLGLALDSGGAGRYRGGCGYEKHIRVLRDAHFMSIADRSILACWGVKGGKAGRPFQVTVDPGGPNEHEVDALADAEPLTAGTVVRIRTTGGGGWGDPLDRPVDEVLRDIAWRKVSVAGRPRGLRRRRRRTTAPRTTTATEALRADAAGRPHRRGAVLRPRPRLRHPLRRRDLQRVRRPLTVPPREARVSAYRSKQRQSFRMTSSWPIAARYSSGARPRPVLPDRQGRRGARRPLDAADRAGDAARGLPVQRARAVPPRHLPIGAVAAPAPSAAGRPRRPRRRRRAARRRVPPDAGRPRPAAGHAGPGRLGRHVGVRRARPGGTGPRPGGPLDQPAPRAGPAPAAPGGRRLRGARAGRRAGTGWSSTPRTSPSAGTTPASRPT